MYLSVKQKSTCPKSGESHFSRRNGGFSLLELLAVVSILSLMLAMVAGTANSLGGTGHSRAALATLTSTLEEARIGALSKGQTHHVVFADKSLPDEAKDLRNRAMAIFVETVNAAGSVELVQVSTWRTLPNRFSLQDTGANNLFDRAEPQTVTTVIGGSDLEITLPAVAFSRGGSVIMEEPEAVNMPLFQSGLASIHAQWRVQLFPATGRTRVEDLSSTNGA